MDDDKQPNVYMDEDLPGLFASRDARISELEAALAFYADPEMHMRRGLQGEYHSLAQAEGGELARRVLGADRWEDIEPAHVDLDL